MLQVGLTGGIGSGKSTVAAIFRVMGIPVADADSEAKRLMNEDEGLREQIIRHFGSAAYVNGRLDRTWMAAQVFPHPEKLSLLNSLVHPVTIAAGKKWMEAQQGHTPYAIREAALIFESHTEKNLDFIIGVSAPQDLRVHRTMARDGVPAEKVIQRMRTQLDETEKMKRCDAVILNDEIHAVLPQVLDLHKELIRRAAGSES